MPQDKQTLLHEEEQDFDDKIFVRLHSSMKEEITRLVGRKGASKLVRSLLRNWLAHQSHEQKG